MEVPLYSSKEEEMLEEAVKNCLSCPYAIQLTAQFDKENRSLVGLNRMTADQYNNQFDKLILEMREKYCVRCDYFVLGKKDVSVN